ncbi:MAG TPA: hypothetical protein VFZ65_11025 [Planctomycetota bacterium]|nr:hypothetical protein [Planctomycetota bacterium]
MNDMLTKIEGLLATKGAPAAPQGPGAEPTSFQRLLDSLDQLVQEHRQAPPVQNAEQLQAAIRAADDGFVTAMDLRKRLEEAFRGQIT